MQGVHLRKYGAATTINFDLYETDGIDLKVDAVDGGSDCSIMKDEGAEATCTNDFVDEGKGYSLALTATEMQAARIVLYIVDSATKVYLDKVIVIETYGNASAQHAMDFDDAVRGGMTALPNAAADAAGGLPISDAGGLDMDNIPSLITTVDTVVDGIQTDLSNGTDGLGALKALIDTLDTVADGIQTDLDNGTDGLGALKALIDGLNDLSAAQVNAEVVDVINTDAHVELASIPTTTSPLRQQVQFVFQLFRNKRTVTVDTETLYKEDGSTVLGTSTISDDGTTFTHGEIS
jgi:hypothetical protein